MELTITDIKELVKGCAAQETTHPFSVGSKWFIRTGTNYLTGEVRTRCGTFIGLCNAAWIADTGRFADAMQAATSRGEGAFNEVEPWPSDHTVWLNTTWIVDATPVTALPGEQK